jgi:hypothetical protein
MPGDTEGLWAGSGTIAHPLIRFLSRIFCSDRPFSAYIVV